MLAPLPNYWGRACPPPPPPHPTPMSKAGLSRKVPLHTAIGACASPVLLSRTVFPAVFNTTCMMTSIYVGGENTLVILIE